MDDIEREERRRKFQAMADETGREVRWRGEKFVPSDLAKPRQFGGILKYGEACPYCGAKQEYATNKRCGKCGADFLGPKVAEPLHVPDAGLLEYKVLTQRDEFFGGKFDPMKLQELINIHATEGWRVVSVATADVSTFFGSFWAGRGARQEIIVFLERTVT